MITNDSSNFSTDIVEISEAMSKHFSCWNNSDGDSSIKLSIPRSRIETTQIVQGDVEDLLMIPRTTFPKFTHLNLGLPKEPTNTVTSDNRTDSWNDINTIRNFRIHKADFEIPRHIQPKCTLPQIKEKFRGGRGHPLIVDLINIVEESQLLAKEPFASKCLLLKECENLLTFSQTHHIRLRVNSQFDLLNCFQNDSNSTGIQSYIYMSRQYFSDTAPYNNVRRYSAIKNYARKKKNRKNRNVIKYSERQELAYRRRRVNGRFLGRMRIS